MIVFVWFMCVGVEECFLIMCKLNELNNEKMSAYIWSFFTIMAMILHAQTAPNFFSRTLSQKISFPPGSHEYDLGLKKL